MFQTGLYSSTEILASDIEKQQRVSFMLQTLY